MPATTLRRGNSSLESAAGSTVPRIPKIAVNNQIRLTYYFRSAKFLLRQVEDGCAGVKLCTAESAISCLACSQAELYRVAHDDRQLFTMLMRFAR